MAREISDDEWNDLNKVVADAILGHQDPGFIDTMALALKEGVYNYYSVSH